MRGNQGNAGTSGKHKRQEYSPLQKFTPGQKQSHFKYWERKWVWMHDFFKQDVTLTFWWVIFPTKFWTIGTDWHFVKAEALNYFLLSRVFHLYPLLSNTESSLFFWKWITEIALSLILEKWCYPFRIFVVWEPWGNWGWFNSNFEMLFLDSWRRKYPEIS